MNTETHTWMGQSGAQYTLGVYDPLVFMALACRPSNKLPGIYIFARRATRDDPFLAWIWGWVPIYIGETKDLSDRFDYHHKAECFRLYGATHIHVMSSSIVDAHRKNIERDLIRQWNPACNDQHANHEQVALASMIGV